MPAEVTSVPIVLQSLLGHLEGIAKADPERPLTAYQAGGFNWLLGHARAKYSDRRLVDMAPLTPEGGHTVGEALERLRAMAEVVLA
ncbi:MAG TPA: hypothetical protein VED18_11215 [Candidatus Sulfotelmatobacter sp.]|nr:hypothetical protein [Candidatus Sulfotelmatobacter sp.]